MSFHAKQQSQRQEPSTQLVPLSLKNHLFCAPCSSLGRTGGGRHPRVSLQEAAVTETWLAWGEGPSPLPGWGPRGQQALGSDPLLSSFLLRLPV